MYNILKKLQKCRFVRKMEFTIYEFLQNSSIHGLIYLARRGLTLIERIFWSLCISVAIMSIVCLSLRTWNRYQTKPLVISLDRNQYSWNTIFPSLTICLKERVDPQKLENFINLQSTQFESEMDKREFGEFIQQLAQLSYDNVDKLIVNRTYGITADNYLHVLQAVKWNFLPEISTATATELQSHETQTEFGICHSVNSLVAQYNSYDYWQKDNWNLLEHGELMSVHPLEGETYAQIVNLSTSYDVYFHSGNDIPNISKRSYTFSERDYTAVELIALEIITVEDARAYTPQQRKCRFMHEAEHMLTTPIYSLGNCLAECRMLFVAKVCGCVPHFYRNRLKNGQVLRICDIKELGCVAKHKTQILSLRQDKCKCLENCDNANYNVEKINVQEWFLGGNLQWGIVNYPKMQLRRKVLFSFTDLLVYIGGLAGFFLGCSFLSFIELFYFLTVRFIKHLLFG